MTHNDKLDDNTLEKLNEFRKRFEKMTDKELIEIREQETKTPGWTTSRSLFLSALREELEKRGINPEITS